MNAWEMRQELLRQIKEEQIAAYFLARCMDGFQGNNAEQWLTKATEYVEQVKDHCPFELYGVEKPRFAAEVLHGMTKDQVCAQCSEDKNNRQCWSAFMDGHFPPVEKKG